MDYNCLDNSNFDLKNKIKRGHFLCGTARRKMIIKVYPAKKSLASLRDPINANLPSAIRTSLNYDNLLYLKTKPLNKKYSNLSNTSKISEEGC